MSTFTVTELTLAIKNNLEPQFAGIALQGEISNFKRQSSGHLYFSLKDSNSQISAVMFHGFASKLKLLPKDGDQVVVVGDLSVYPPHGKYQLVIHTLTLLGIGELLLKLEQLKREIQRRGWFDNAHKKPLPSLPHRIGIITSPTGAAIQDILKVLGRRFAGLHIILYPVKVQGDGSKEEIAQAIVDFNRFKLVDVLIVGRGGGSIEDLWAFNEEIVARAIFESTIPIICAVGHETDHCIAEYVADMRAPTPSAAAEMVIAEQAQLLKVLENYKKNLSHYMTGELKKTRKELQNFMRLPLFSSAYPILGQRFQRIDELQGRLELSHPEHKLKILKEKFFTLQTSIHQAEKRQLQEKTVRLSFFKKTCFSHLNHLKRKLPETFPLAYYTRLLETAWSQTLQKQVAHLSKVEETLNALSPKKVLERGYTILFSENEQVITSAKNLENHQKIQLLMHDGRAKATVTEVSLGEK